MNEDPNSQTGFAQRNTVDKVGFLYLFRELTDTNHRNENLGRTIMNTVLNTCVDDGSTDGSLGILQRYAKMAPGFKFIRDRSRVQALPEF